MQVQIPMQTQIRVQTKMQIQMRILMRIPMQIALVQERTLAQATIIKRKREAKVLASFFHEFLY